jgi:hypothetical protein
MSTSISQHQCHKCCKEPFAPFQNQAHESEVSFHERQCRERENSLFYIALGAKPLHDAYQ